MNLPEQAKPLSRTDAQRQSVVRTPDARTATNVTPRGVVPADSSCDECYGLPGLAANFCLQNC